MWRNNGRICVRCIREKRQNLDMVVRCYIDVKYWYMVGYGVWGAICIRHRLTLIIINNTLNTRRYVEEILDSVLLPFIPALSNVVLQQDNGRLYVPVHTREYLQLINTNLRHCVHTSVTIAIPVTGFKPH